jgi:hypothetical protein
LRRVPAGEVRPERFSIALNLDQSWQLDDDYRLFSGDRHTSGGGISATVNVIELAPEVSLHAMIDLMAEDTSGSWAFGTSELESSRFAAGGLIRYEPTWWLAPYARVVGGAEHSEVRLKGVDGALSDEQWGPFGTAGLGVSFRSWPRRLAGGTGSALLALNIEGGFTVAKPLDLNLKPASPNPDDDAISLTPIAVGQLGRNRPYLRISISAHF